MNKRTKFAIIISAVAAVISAAVLVIVFWDKLLEKFPCRKSWQWEPEEEDAFEEPELAYTEEETADFADLSEEA